MFNVLVVDDEPDMVDMMVVAINEDSRCVGRMRAYGATSAAGALEILRTRRIDLLFTDLLMPHLQDGLDFVRQVRATWPWLHVITVTGAPSEVVSEDEARQAGVQGFLPKPFGLPEFFRSVQNALFPEESC